MPLSLYLDKGLSPVVLGIVEEGVASRCCDTTLEDVRGLALGVAYLDIDVILFLVVEGERIGDARRIRVLRSGLGIITPTPGFLGDPVDQVLLLGLGTFRYFNVGRQTDDLHDGISGRGVLMRIRTVRDEDRGDIMPIRQGGDIQGGDIDVTIDDGSLDHELGALTGIQTRLRDVDVHRKADGRTHVRDQRGSVTVGDEDTGTWGVRLHVRSAHGVGIHLDGDHDD